MSPTSTRRNLALTSLFGALFGGIAAAGAPAPNPEAFGATPCSFPSRSSAVAARIPHNARVLGIVLLGYAFPGDGGQSYYRYVADEPPHQGKIQSRDGAWWELACAELNPMMFGADGTGDASARHRNVSAFQGALGTLQSRGGGTLRIPPGTYVLSCANLILVPNNVTIEGTRGATILMPFVPDLPPKLTYGVFVTGDALARRTRPAPMGEGNAFGVVGPDVQGADVHIRDVTVVCDYAGPVLQSGRVHGFVFWHMRRSSVTRCEVRRTPNTGIYSFGGSELDFSENLVEECGHTGSASSTCNGISVGGYLASNSEHLTSHSVTICRNKSLNNRDEGIMFANIGGVIISDNILVGNKDRGIEGDSHFVLPVTSKSLGFPVPNDVIISGNYVDGRGRYGVASSQGITVACGNEGRIIVKANVIANVVGPSAIIVTQAHGGLVQIQDNVLDNVRISEDRPAIYCHCNEAKVSGNRVANASSLSKANSTAAISVEVREFADVSANEIGSGFPTAIAVGCKLSPEHSGVDVIRVSGNVIRGCGYSAIRIYLRLDGTVRCADVSENLVVSMNETSSRDAAFLSLIGDGAESTTLDRLIVFSNRVQCGRNTAYPIQTHQVREGAVSFASIRNNEFWNPHLLPASRLMNSTRVAVWLHESGNILSHEGPRTD